MRMILLLFFFAPRLAFTCASPQADEELNRFSSLLQVVHQKLAPAVDTIVQTQPSSFKLAHQHQLPQIVRILQNGKDSLLSFHHASDVPIAQAAVAEIVRGMSNSLLDYQKSLAPISSLEQAETLATLEAAASNLAQQLFVLSRAQKFVEEGIYPLGESAFVLKDLFVGLKHVVVDLGRHHNQSYWGDFDELMRATELWVKNLEPTENDGLKLKLERTPIDNGEKIVVSFKFTGGKLPVQQNADLFMASAIISQHGGATAKDGFSVTVGKHGDLRRCETRYDSLCTVID